MQSHHTLSLKLNNHSQIISIITPTPPVALPHSPNLSQYIHKIQITQIESPQLTQPLPNSLILPISHQAFLQKYIYLTQLTLLQIM